MRHELKNRHQVFRRGWGTFYCEDLVTKKQESLKTRDKDEAAGLMALTAILTHGIIRVIGPEPDTALSIYRL